MSWLSSGSSGANTLKGRGAGMPVARKKNKYRLFHELLRSSLEPSVLEGDGSLLGDLERRKG